MNMGKKITELREGTKVPRESRYVVEMGDGTGTKQVKHHNLVAQLLEDMSLGYDETMEFLNGTGIAEGNEALRAFRDWLVSRVVNNLMTTEAGFFLDGRAGKTLADGLAEINSNLRWRTIFYGSAQMEAECVAIGDGFINCATVAIICSSGQDWCTGMFYIVAQDFPQHCDFTAPIGEGFVKIRIHAGGKSFTVLQNTSGHLVRRIYAR